jgi:Resolvase, N terminal domain
LKLRSYFGAKGFNERMANMLVGYARVSSDGQSVEAQTQALKTAECERIFSEKISGAIADRRQLRTLMGLPRNH